MQLQINDNRRIHEVQADFAAEFPYLKIKFFSKRDLMGKGLGKTVMMDERLSIKECRKKRNEGSLEVKPDMTVGDVETRFWDEFGLSVQIFRKSGSSWLETTATDSWTLEKQNRLGKDISNFRVNEEREEFDNDRTK